jgi:hypothetical protein
MPVEAWSLEELIDLSAHQNLPPVPPQFRRPENGLSSLPILVMDISCLVEKVNRSQQAQDLHWFTFSTRHEIYAERLWLHLIEALIWQYVLHVNKGEYIIEHPILQLMVNRCISSQTRRCIHLQAHILHSEGLGASDQQKQATSNQ